MDKHMTEKITVESILEGKKDFFALNFELAEDRETALTCMDKMQIFARRMNVNDPTHLDLLKMWIERKYDNIFFLSPEQRCKELITLFLELKFYNQLECRKIDPTLAKSVSLSKSYTKQLVICCNYETKEGEVFGYFDEKLNIPVKLQTSAVIKFKLVDALELIKRIDIEFERVDFEFVINFINNMIWENLRTTLLDVICKNKISYYDLPEHMVEIKDVLLDKLRVATEGSGLTVSDLKVNDVSLINRIDEVLEKQFYGLAKLARMKEFEYKQEEESLKFYEKKAMIHAAYPDFEVGLTEAEKDFALDRYLKRKEIAKDLGVEVYNQKTGQRFAEHTGEATRVSIKKPEPPVPLVASHKYLTRLIVLIVASLVAAAIAAVLPDYPILWGVTAALGIITILYGIINRYKIKYGVSKQEKEEYDEKLKTYNILLGEYNQQTKHLSFEQQSEAAVTQSPDTSYEPERPYEYDESDNQDM